ncbi:MAG: carboxypeptidase-like regulatory domain-containing protein [Candidatus Delongbacteria bacterium]
MKTFYSILFVFMSANLFCAGMIRGRVSSVEGQPLSEANVTIIATSLGSATNQKGIYAIRGVEPGKYILKCSYVGYRDAIMRNVLIEDSETLEIDFVLYPVEYKLQAIEVTQAKEDYMNLLYSRELVFPSVITTFEAKKPDPPRELDIRTNVGFWERTRHFFYKLFN